MGSSKCVCLMAQESNTAPGIVVIVAINSAENGVNEGWLLVIGDVVLDTAASKIHVG